MRKWGTVITGFYALVLFVLIVPLAVLITPKEPGTKLVAGTMGFYSDWHGWFVILVLIASQALLLCLSVDTSFQKLKPRAHILVSALLTGTLTALLIGAAVLSLGFGVVGDHFGEKFLDHGNNFLISWGILWLAWAVIFYLYFRNSGPVIDRITSWLLRGSVLELLIAVPSHVIVRRRQDCSAPLFTSFGIATGISIMLLCFGPSVLFLYTKRLTEYKQRKAAAG